MDEAGVGMCVLAAIRPPQGGRAVAASTRPYASARWMETLIFPYLLKRQQWNIMHRNISIAYLSILASR